MSNQLRIHVPKPLKEVLVAQPFWFLFPDRAGTLFSDTDLPDNFFQKEAEIVSIERAQAIVLAHNFNQDTEEIQAYIRQHADEAQKYKIPIFLFSGGDFTDRLHFDPRVYVFRQSVYRSTMSPQVIATPTLSADFGEDGFSIRAKQSIPIVSFCGQAGYPTAKQWIKYELKVLLYKMWSLINPSAYARIIGVYFRRRMLRACSRSKEVQTHFIIRNSFSGATRTIELDPAQARQEFVQSIIESDFVLAPKGDGNYSNRFLEALSLGRIPVVLDTEMVLPLEDEIDYDSFIVRVPMNHIDETPEIIRAWYDAHNAVAWQAAQHRAREVFETRLRFDAFFAHFFETVLPTLPIDAREHTISL